MQHHEDTLTAYLGRVRRAPDSLGLVVTGSVARGEERPDSDVDVALVVTEEAFARARAEDRLSYVEQDVATYPGGYVDVKVIGPSWLAAVRDHADEPTRASLRGARVVWTTLPDLAETLDAAATASDEDAWRERLVTAVARMRLQGVYFLGQGRTLADPFLAHAAAVEFVRAAGRALLAHSRVLYAGPKYLRSAVRRLPGVPADLPAAFDDLLGDPDPDRAREILVAVEQIVQAPLPPEATLGRFVADNELSWLWTVADETMHASRRPT